MCVCVNQSQLAAKLDSDWAGLAVAQLMPDAATVQLAIRYAGRLRRQHLAHKLSAVALAKEHAAAAVAEDEGDAEGGEDNSSSDDQAPAFRTTPFPRRQRHQ